MAFLKSLFRFAERSAQAKARATLHRMTDRELKDIGITRGEINSRV